ncbi:MAG: hypothetical protein ABI333_26845 [bacterium]
MSDQRTKDEIRRELEALGEPAANAEEIAAAERLASRLEGSLHVVDAGDDADLAGLVRTVRSTAGSAGDAGAAVTDQLLAELFERKDAALDTPPDELEERRAQALAAGVDRMIAGCLPGDVPGDVRELLRACAMIRASAHAVGLSAGRLETLVEQAYGASAPEAAAPQPQRTGRVLRLALAAAVAVIVLGAGLVAGGLLQRSGAPAVQERLPTHLTSRTTRDILPHAFPRSQTSTERIDLIYHDRLRSYRELSLGAFDGSGRSGR